MTDLTRRDVLLSGTVAGVLPGLLGCQPALAAEPALPASLLRLVDPELRSPALLQPSTVDAGNLAETRARMARWVPPYLPRPAVAARTVPGRHGAPDVPLFVINAGRSASAPRPAILYMHGGGFVAGHAAGEMAMAQQIALDQDCVVVSVDYRLAPEVPFPGPMEDNYAALLWLHANADALGVDRTRIALMGCSAGGGHAAILAGIARDRGEVPLLFQLLISPMLDDRTGSSRAAPPGVGRFVWTAAANRFGWSSFLGAPAGSARVPRGAVPSRRADLGGMPPTYIGVGSIDLFVGENIAYAERLLAAGVPIELDVVPGAYHVFFAIRPEADVSKRFLASCRQALARAFRLPAPGG